MRFARFGSPGDEVPALVEGDLVLGLRPLTKDIDGQFLQSDFRSDIVNARHTGLLPILDVDGLRVASPIARPGKIVCIGLNYRDHAAESGVPAPAEPVVFLKDPNTIVGPFDDVLVPRRSIKTDWEVELGVVIGKTARYLESAESAMDHIAGFVVSHDVSEREFQLERGGQWDKGKSCETFNPLGPHLVTDVPHPQNLRMSLWVNGVLRQNGNTADMIFPIGEVIRYLSQFMVLHPGDLINTGTPAGVAFGNGTEYLAPGDLVELEISGLGRARQRVSAA